MTITTILVEPPQHSSFCPRQFTDIWFHFHLLNTSLSWVDGKREKGPSCGGCSDSQDWALGRATASLLQLHPDGQP